MCCTSQINGSINNLELPDSEEPLEDIEVFNVITPNGDGVHDAFFIANLHQFTNNTVTIFNTKNEIVYSTENYGANENFFRGEGLEEGSYIYELVIDSRKVFLMKGYLCLVKESASNFSSLDECNQFSPDYILQ
jgi:gliding motility-associated-like protein